MTDVVQRRIKVSKVKHVRSPAEGGIRMNPQDCPTKTVVNHLIGPFGSIESQFAFRMGDPQNYESLKTIG